MRKDKAVVEEGQETEEQGIGKVTNVDFVTAMN